MSAEWLGAIASLLTFIVIGATAVTALVQLRHIRNSNQIAVFTEIRHNLESPELRRTLSLIRSEFPQKMHDPEFRMRLFDPNSEESRMVRDFGNFLDGAIAPLVKHGMVDRDLACDLFYVPVVTAWDTLAPYIATSRALLGYSMWEDLEYLRLLCEDFRERYPDGTYPKHAKRLLLPQPWPELEAIRSQRTADEP